MYVCIHACTVGIYVIEYSEDTEARLCVRGYVQFSYQLQQRASTLVVYLHGIYMHIYYIHIHIHIHIQLQYYMYVCMYVCMHAWFRPIAQPAVYSPGQYRPTDVSGLQARIICFEKKHKV